MSIYIPANTFAGLCLFGRQRSCLRRYADMCLVRGRHFFLEARRRLPAGSTLASQTRALLLARRGGGSADAFPGVPGAGSFVD